MEQNPIFTFETAKRLQCKASIMIESLTGMGKSGLALLLGFYLAGGDWTKVFDIDTENKSANLFAGIPFSNGSPVGPFKVGQLTDDIGYKPSYFLAYREAAIKMGALVVIEDSISHAWQYRGGVLDIVNEAKDRTKNKNDKYAAWGDEAVINEKQNLLNLVRTPEVHVITTVRVKEKFDYADVEGKQKLVSIGEQQIQQADLKYEPDLVLHMVRPGSATQPPRAEVIKSRYTILTKGEEYDFTPELCLAIKAYLEEGADPNVLLEQQRQEYIAAITEHLDAHPNKRAIWGVMKDDAGYDNISLANLPLVGIKKLFIKLTTD